MGVSWVPLNKRHMTCLPSGGICPVGASLKSSILGSVSKLWVVGEMQRPREAVGDSPQSLLLPCRPLPGSCSQLGLCCPGSPTTQLWLCLWVWSGLLATVASVTPYPVLGCSISVLATFGFPYPPPSQTQAPASLEDALKGRERQRNKEAELLVRAFC